MGGHLGRGFVQKAQPLAASPGSALRVTLLLRTLAISYCDLDMNPANKAVMNSTKLQGFS